MAVRYDDDVDLDDLDDLGYSFLGQVVTRGPVRRGEVKVRTTGAQMSLSQLDA